MTNTTDAHPSARAYWTVARERGELRTESLPSVDEDDVLVRTRYSAVSRGTERIVHTHAVPPSEYERMRAPFQKGDFPHPVKYGYMSVGVVEAGPRALVDRTVFCLHPHQDRYVVPASSVTVVPDDVPARRAVLAANVETAVNVLWDARPSLGDRVAVVGAGVVGCAVAHLAAGIAGVRPTLFDVRSERRDVADALGVPFEGVAPDTPAPKGFDADVVVHASGNPDGLSLALDLAGDEGTVVEASWFGEALVPAPLGGAFHSRRLRLVSSQVGSIPPHRARRWTHARRIGLALELLRDSRFDALLSSEGQFEDIVDALPRALEDPDTLCATFRYD
ncbi:MAG: zinc-binding alcohol dehydrogenase [Planctomycetota bacterium]